MADPLRVSLVNDYEIIVRGLEHMLEPFSHRVEIVELEAGGVPGRPADVVLFDTFAGRRRSLERVEEIDARDHVGRLVLYTWDVSSDFLVDVDEAHVEGIILTSRQGADLVDALERVAQARPSASICSPTRTNRLLSEREREVLALIARGLSNPDIARELYLSVDTVKTHARSLFRKLEVNDRTQAALLAHRYQLDDPAAATPGRR